MLIFQGFTKQPTMSETWTAQVMNYVVYKPSTPEIHGEGAADDLRILVSNVKMLQQHLF